jgi:hypothetical protein
MSFDEIEVGYYLWRSLTLTSVRRGGNTDTDMNMFRIVTTEALLRDTCILLRIVIVI